MSVRIAIVDYGMGNLHSVYRKFNLLGVETIIATKASEILKTDKIVLPGVGHFGKAIENLKTSGPYDALNDAIIFKKKPILGICLGMQLMASGSEEGDVAGFGWFKAQVIKFHIQNTLRYKVPQTGWNTISINKNSSLLKDIKDETEFYFLHSFHYNLADRSAILTTSHFEYEFVSAVENDNIFGTQFHPEKSHDAGMKVLKNFLDL